MKHIKLSPKKLLATLISIAMLATMAVPAVSAATDTDNVTYTMISTEAELKAVANDVEGNYKLANDITLSDVGEGESNWTELDFKGIFDGNGYAIKNLKMVNDAPGNWQSFGFFGTADGATIKNLTIQGNLHSALNYQLEIGAFCSATKNGTTISNCVSEVDITTGSVSSNSYVAAFAAVAAEGTVIENCVNKGDFLVKSNEKTCYIGGIVGRVTGVTTITGCANEGKLESAGGEHSTLIGGIAAHVLVADETNNQVTITRCVNAATIISDSRYLGGIVARAEKGKLDISYSANLGNLENVYFWATAYSVFFGGIVGRNNMGEGLTISYCYNDAGDELGSLTNINLAYIGGIVGSESGGTYRYNYTTKFTYLPAGDANSAYACIFGYGHGSSLGTGVKVGNGVVEDGADLEGVATILNAGLPENDPMFVVEDGVMTAMSYSYEAPETGDSGNGGGTGTGTGSGTGTGTGIGTTNKGEDTTAKDDQTTEAPVNNDAPTSNSNTDAGKKGCGSVVFSGMTILLTLGAAVAVTKKKED